MGESCLLVQVRSHSQLHTGSCFLAEAELKFLQEVLLQAASEVLDAKAIFTCQQLQAVILASGDGPGLRKPVAQQREAVSVCLH